MGVAHHTAYPVWFEMGRTELLRSAGLAYAALERDGALLAVVKLEVSYRCPARYDDMLELDTSLLSCGRAKIEHAYTLRRDDTVLASARTVLACLDRTGRIREIPEQLRQCCGSEGEAGRVR